MNPLVAVAVFAAAALVSLLATPLARRVAHAYGAVDRPDGGRKKHANPIALLGGLAVAMTTATVVGLIALLAPNLVQMSRGSFTTAFVPAAMVLIVVGLVDDIRGLTGIYKLVGQVLAVSLLIAGGMLFDEISLFGWLFRLGNLSVPFTMFFCLGAINAFNLIDGADGLASSVGGVVCVTLGVVAGMQGDVVASLFCFAFAGALVGFLRYNAPPATIYLGDTGSMLIGLIVAAVAIHSTIKEQAAIALVVPVAVCAIPIIDAGAAMVRRITTGQSVFTADRGHLHHSLLLRGLSVGWTVAAITALTVLTCLGAFVSYYTGKDYYALAAAVGVFVALAGFRIFGHAEAMLIASHVRGAMRTSLLGRLRPRSGGTEKSVTLQGDRKWEKIWLGLREAAPVYNMAAIKLNVSIPNLHESFYAAWKSDDFDNASDAWHMSIPLRLAGQTIGKISVTGQSSGREGLQEIQQVVDFLEPLESEIENFLGSVEPPAVAPAAPSALESASEQPRGQPTEHRPLVSPVDARA